MANAIDGEKRRKLSLVLSLRFRRSIWSDQFITPGSGHHVANFANCEIQSSLKREMRIATGAK